MKTRKEVEDLKRSWKNDPCWDIEDTEGFEEYRDELIGFSEKCKKEADENWEKSKKVLVKTASIYPSTLSNNIDNPFDGLTKRELFAAMAMQGILSNSEVMKNHKDLNIEQTAIIYADGLIYELNK